MMKKLIIANWKMNLSLAESKNLARKLKAGLLLSSARRKAEIVLCPSFDCLTTVGQVIKNSSMNLGAQDVFWQEYGPFTGEIAPANLKEIGCKYVIIGHSERRKHLGETNDMVNRKVKEVLDNGLIPIVCVGETIEQRREQQQDLAVMTQVLEGLAGLDLSEDQTMIIAYEPVWVIGTGQAIEPEEANRMSCVIRQALIDLFPLEIVDNNCQIIYGGSVDESNIADFLSLELMSGALVGGASLEAKKFISLIKSLP